jgi:histidine triad (HIT) family protein
MIVISFAKILRGEIPCNKIYEDDFVLSFNDINPQKKIHALVIPKGKYVDLDDFRFKCIPRRNGWID